MASSNRYTRKKGIEFQSFIGNVGPFGRSHELVVRLIRLFLLVIKSGQKIYMLIFMVRGPRKFQFQRRQKTWHFALFLIAADLCERSSDLPM